MHDEFQKFVVDHWESSYRLGTRMFLGTCLDVGTDYGSVSNESKENYVQMGLLYLEKHLREELDVVLDQIHVRTDVLRDGDRNTKFFHACAVVHRRRYKTKGLFDANGGMVSKHFAKLFSAENEQMDPIDLPRGQFPTLNNQEYDSFSRDYEH
ncbi:LOW QUALITY PROTEIN: hypothetical protein V2J09_010623 [Rumex salicifolius]